MGAKLAIVTPSYIDSAGRAAWAEKSLASLRAAGGSAYPHFVVDDLPRMRYPVIGRWLINRRYRRQAETIYRGDNIHLFRQRGRSGTAALLRAVREARAAGCDLVFIHLDDHVYAPVLADLLRYSIDAFEQTPELAWVRMSAYPIVSRTNTPELGNRADLRIENDTVQFQNICLEPVRRETYTLWRAVCREDWIGGRFWPFVLWLTVYRTFQLENMLAEVVDIAPRLGRAEACFQEPSRWTQVLRSYPAATLGYINMQFGGFEMHRNKNWETILQWPNVAVR